MSEHASITNPVAQAARVDEVLRQGIARLEQAQIPSAALSAELLLMHAFGRDRAWLYAHPEHELDAAIAGLFASLIAQRASGTPTQYLTGRQEFWGLEFEVTPAVLIPRPETEHLIEAALAHFATGRPGGQQELRIVDVGTGSGCIAISLAKELPSASFVATDVDAAALEVARRNAARHRVSERVHFVECNLLDALLHPAQPGNPDSRPFERVDLVVSNPPYIAREEADTLPREVRDHEPHIALFGGDTGAGLYAPLIAQAAQLLKPDGLLLLELGYNSAEAVLRLLDAPEWREVSITPDLAGIARVASSRRTAQPIP